MNKVQALNNFCEGFKYCPDCPLYNDPKAFALCDNCGFEEMTANQLDYLLSVAGLNDNTTNDNPADKVTIHGEICDGIKELYKTKNQDYGDSFSILRNKYPQSICIRLWDKLLRLETLMRPGYEPKVTDERIEDTLRDIANYAIMELTERKYENESKD